uniref:Reverse transcriptase domain-containing protein n=1 Tax=Tanacetum cinerariifolium TaxID=118510 RepID=A0A6L2JQ26_TANCI|nr:hypothetical protein [Tanacetum cinerariifolium]
MANQRTMAQLLQAPIEGYEDTIVVPVITADNFELKHGLLTLVQNKQFFGHDKEDPHAHIRYFNKITSTLKFPNVPNTSIKLMLFLFSLEDLLRACPHHGFSELHQLDTFYNALNSKDHDSLNSAVGGNFLDKMPRECLAIIESKSKVCYLRNKPVVDKVSMNTSTFGISPNVAELKDMVKALLLDKKSQNQASTTVKAVEESCVTCSGTHSYRNCPATDGNVYHDNIQEFVSQASTNVQLNQRNNQNHFNQNQNRNNLNHGPVYQPPAYQAPAYQASAPQTQGVSKEDFSAYVKANDAVMRNMQTQGTLPSNTIANPISDLKAITTRSGVSYDGPQILPPSSFLPKVVENEPEATKDTIFQDMSFEINFADALILMPKFASTLKALIENKEKLSEMARAPLNEHCSAVLLKKLPEKLGDPGKPIGVAEDVYVKVGKFHFPSDFVVVDFDADPRVPLFLGRSFLKTERALIDVFEGELTLRVGKEAITFNLDQTSRYLANYSYMTANRIDVIDMAYEEYSQEVFGFSTYFLLEEVDAFLALKDDPTSPKVDQSYLDSEGDILLLEAFLNDDPSLPLPNQGNYLPEVRKELKIRKAKSNKSSIDEPPEVELKDLPPHLEYAFLEGDGKFLVIIAKDLSVEEKTTLITFLWVFQILIDPEDQEKTTFTCPYRTFAYRCMPFGLCNAPGMFHMCMMAIFHDKIEKTMEVFMDDFLVFENSFQSCLSYLEKMLKRCEDTNLCLNWEKSHFMVKEGKLKSHWSGPFTISHVYPYGTIELSQPDGPNFKVNGHRVKHYFGEDVPKMVVPDL